MNLSALFIKRPVTTTLIMLGVIVFGAMAYRQLPVSDLPTIDFPTINVNAGLPGASPETMASAVALPLEKQFASIAGLNSINSTSSLGRTNIVLQFDLSRNIDAAAQDVQSMIARAQRSLPPQMQAPPTFQEVNPGDQGVMTTALRQARPPQSSRSSPSMPQPRKSSSASARPETTATTPAPAPATLAEARPDNTASPSRNSSARSAARSSMT